MARLDVQLVDTVVADLRVGHRDDLSSVGRIGENLLVSHHGGVEHDFPRPLAGRADRATREDPSVLQRQNRFHRLLQRSMARPTSGAIFPSSCMRSVNIAGYSDCGPSDRAASGSGCTSTMTPSAPTARAALARGPTFSRRPVPWLGSTKMGRWLRFLTAGMTERSSVLRAWSAKVRTPLSQRTTL